MELPGHVIWCGTASLLVVGGVSHCPQLLENCKEVWTHPGRQRPATEGEAWARPGRQRPATEGEAWAHPGRQQAAEGEAWAHPGRQQPAVNIRCECDSNSCRDS